jgi:hypothetical protein
VLKYTVNKKINASTRFEIKNLLCAAWVWKLETADRANVTKPTTAILTFTTAVHVCCGLVRPAERPNISIAITDTNGGIDKN